MKDEEKKLPKDSERRGKEVTQGFGKTRKRSYPRIRKDEENMELIAEGTYSLLITH
jgi:hypothetical protein